jgi:type IX secretion system PorP/SprF family membrane protein
MKNQMKKFILFLQNNFVGNPKLIVLSAICLLCEINAFAQQDAMYSQYMFNGLAINPAYAGSRSVLSATGLFRRQWAGKKIEGAPITETFTIDAPLPKRKTGLGLNVVNDKIGVTNSLALDLVYAYRIKINRYKTLSLGLQAGIWQYRANFTDINLSRDLTLQQDEAFQNNINRWDPNFGFGAYYYTKIFYAGLSFPHLLNSKLISKQDNANSAYGYLSDSEKARQFRHAFFTMGYLMKFTKKYLKLKPSILIKYVYGAPIELDLNANLWFYEKYSVGLSVRTADAVALLLEAQASKQWRFGYSYDYSYTKLRKYNSGSHELMVRYEFSYQKSKLLTPRYF